MADYRNLTPEECADILIGCENPAILIHARPDGDCVGSAAALFVILEELGKHAVIASSDNIPKRLEFIIEKVGAPLSKNIEGRSQISIDVASPAQLGDLEHAAPILMIDHHAIGDRFADGYVLPDISSAGEVLFDIVDVLIKRGLITLTEKLAYTLYTAISSDTGCFKYSNATKETHRRAAILMEAGIDTADINRRLFDSKTKEQIKAEGIVAGKLKLEFGGAVAHSAITLADMASEGLSSEDFDTGVDVVRTVLGVKIAVFMREIKPGRFKASIRSTGADVARIAQKFGGGGHIRAAGCSPDAKNIDDAVSMLLSEIKKII